MSFNDAAILAYLSLENEEGKQPSDDPINFLLAYLRLLPPHLSRQFSLITTPKQRTAIPLIRNRRNHFTKGSPPELSFQAARNAWPTLWQGRERRGIEEGREEREWAKSNFLQGSTMHVGKIGNLLGEYEEEREAERVRTIRRAEAESTIVPEEEDSDESDGETEMDPPPEQPETDAEAKAIFERRVRERFIYGLLDGIDYDNIDWDENLDAEHDLEEQERWFDDSEEEMMDEA